MIDLHSHILPGIDDGADTLETSLQMARIAVAEGTEVLACTPHIYPGLYMNEAGDIRRRTQALQAELDARGIALRLVAGADAHLVPELLAGLRAGRVPTLAGSRYFLLEPSHHVLPPNFESSVSQIMAAGYVPVITHPERLPWIEEHHGLLLRLAGQGAWLQLTAGALLGRFGKRPRYWSERLLGEGWVHLLASDAHGTGTRAPGLAEAAQRAASLVGHEQAQQLVRTRAQAILDDTPPQDTAPVPALHALDDAAGDARPWYRRLLGLR